MVTIRRSIKLSRITHATPAHDKNLQIRMKTGNRIPTKLIRQFLVAGTVGLAFVGSVFADEYTDVNQLVRAGKFSEASTKADSYLASNPRDPQMRFLKGVIQTESGRQTDAIATFTSLTQEFPELPEPYNNLAVLYANEKQYDKARTALEMAIRTNPSYATAHENMGDVYAKLASQAYSKALQLDSSNTQVPAKLALIRELFTPASNKAKLASSGSGATKTPPVVVAAAAMPTVPEALTRSAATPNATTAATRPTQSPAINLPVAPTATRLPIVPESKSELPAVTPVNPSAAASGIQKANKADSVKDVTNEVTAAVNDWATAWSAQDMKDYLAAYGRNFRPSGKQSRSAWEAERRSRIVGKKSIKVVVSDLVVKIEGDAATARFRQAYDAASLSVTSRKTLEFQKVDGRWVIVRESTG